MATPASLRAQIEQLRITDPDPPSEAAKTYDYAYNHAIADVLALLDAPVVEPTPLQHKLNGWREIGEEVVRMMAFLTPEQKDDLFPDWFGPRLVDLLEATPDPLPAAVARPEDR